MHPQYIRRPWGRENMAFLLSPLTSGNQIYKAGMERME